MIIAVNIILLSLITDRTVLVFLLHQFSAFDVAVDLGIEVHYFAQHEFMGVLLLWSFFYCGGSHEDLGSVLAVHFEIIFHFFIIVLALLLGFFLDDLLANRSFLFHFVHFLHEDFYFLHVDHQLLRVLLIICAHLFFVLVSQLLQLLLVRYSHQLHLVPHGLDFLSWLEVFLGSGCVWLVFE